MKTLLAIVLSCLALPASATFLMTPTHCRLYNDYVLALYRQHDTGVTQSDAYRDAVRWANMPDAQPERIQVFPLMMSAFDFVYSQEDNLAREKRIAVQAQHCQSLIDRKIKIP